MTMPNERARALRWAGEFIQDLAASGELSEERKREAQAILRHYPSAAEIRSQSAATKQDFAGPWLAAEQDFNDFSSNLNSLIDKCRAMSVDSHALADATQRKQAVNVQIALLELGHDVTVAVAAAVWRHHSNSLAAGWMSGAETVASAKRTLIAYCARNPTD